MPLENLQPLTQFGVAGLMGVLWVWERLMSRKHEAQLDAAHQRLMGQRQELEVLVDLVARNTAAIERFDQTQAQLRQLLEKMHYELERKAA
jgi:hypothetical protein